MNRVHIVGAGLAGLAAGVRLTVAGYPVTLYESNGHAGGRCRSFHDSVLDCMIDNGNHLLLSGNCSARTFLREIGAEDTMSGPSEADFPFIDLKTGDRWSVRLNSGAFPWWLLSRERRPPDTSILDFLSMLRLAWAGPDATVTDILKYDDAVFTRFAEPLAIAALNTPLNTAAARPLWNVLRETFGRGGAACRPLIARDGLSRSFVDPALGVLRRFGAGIWFNQRLRDLDISNSVVRNLRFGNMSIEVAPTEKVVFALPPIGLNAVMPEISVPTGSHAIVNAHFKLPTPISGMQGKSLLGVVGGIAEWVFIRGSILSVTVSAADELAKKSAAEIGVLIWSDVARALDLPKNPPQFRIVKERRATFAQTPSAMRCRPGTKTQNKNLFSAGDWTDTGLPATIESAIRSGHNAAAAIIAS